MAAECHPGPVDLSDDLPPPRRPLFFPVVIAAVFLSIIGLSAGLVLGSRDRDTPRTALTPDPVTPATSVTTGPVRNACRPETQAAGRSAGATGTLTRVLLLKTRTSVVYICRDEAGSLYYHANNGGNLWIENQTALFLPDVVRRGDDYEVTAADGATFSVNRKRLLIRHADGRQEVQPAVE